MRLTWLADVARGAGLRVVEVGGWRTRGREYTETPGVWLYHHTAENRNSGDSGGLNIVTHGRAGLPGPIANYYLSRSGIVYVVASGVSNNAGTGNGRVAGLPNSRENEDTIAVEMANNGIGEPYSPAMYTAAIKLGAAVARKMGWSASRFIGHKEWSTTGKIDPTWNMAQARRDVAAALAGNLDENEDDMLKDEKIDIPAGPVSPLPDGARKGMDNASDVLAYARREISDVHKELKALGVVVAGKVTPSVPDIDYDKLAQALLRNMK